MLWGNDAGKGPAARDAEPIREGRGRGERPAASAGALVRWHKAVASEPGEVLHDVIAPRQWDGRRSLPPPPPLPPLLQLQQKGRRRPRPFASRDDNTPAAAHAGHAAHGSTAQIFVNQPAAHAGKVGHDVLRHDNVVEDRGRYWRLFEGLDGGLRRR